MVVPVEFAWGGLRAGAGGLVPGGGVRRDVEQRVVVWLGGSLSGLLLAGPRGPFGLVDRLLVGTEALTGRGQIPVRVQAD